MSLKRLRKHLAQIKRIPLSIVLMATGATVLYLLTIQGLHVPLLGDHCMKTSKSVEVSYNMVRYGDPFHQYADWQATKDNLYGQTGSIIGYESPLSALLLASIYLVVDSENFMTRLNTARYFTLFHLIGGFLLLSFFILQKDIFAQTTFSILFIVSNFTISFATQPFVESMAILYQAGFLVVTVCLLGRPMHPVRKSLLIAAAAFLLCVGGKMNYFLIGIPVIIGLPFVDRSLSGIKSKLLYLAVFGAGGALLLVMLLVFTDLNFANIFTFMIKGNKPIINNSLWDTFLEGFSGFDELLKRTKEDFGWLPFKGGLWGCFYLVIRFIGVSILKRGKPLSDRDAFSRVLLLFVLGHALNYVVLRNLYIPHKYYVIPLYGIFCLALTVLIADIRSAIFTPFPTKTWIWTRMSARLPRRIATFLSDENWRALTRSSLFIISASMLSVSAVTAVSAYTFDSQHHWKTTFVLAAKSLGSTTLALDLLDVFRNIVTTLYIVSATLLAATILLLVLYRVLRHNLVVQGIIRGSSRAFDRHGVSFQRVAIGLFFATLVTYSTLKTGQSLYNWGSRYFEHIDNAKALAKIRRDTKPGELVLCWKWCIAFYADKRSITDARVEDLSYYRKHNIHSVMGPVKPLNRYYKRIEKYPEPMSYWRPMTKQELAQKNKTRKKKKKK